MLYADQSYFGWDDQPYRFDKKNKQIHTQSCEDKIYTTKGKKTMILTIPDWELKLEEHATLLKLTVSIHIRTLTRFKQESLLNILLSKANINTYNS